jgi:hypothetical protein
VAKLGAIAVATEMMGHAALTVEARGSAQLAAELQEEATKLQRIATQCAKALRHGSGEPAPAACLRHMQATGNAAAAERAAGAAELPRPAQPRRAGGGGMRHPRVRRRAR